MKIIDTHCHLNDKALFCDLDNVVNRALKAGVEKMLVVGWDEESSKLAIKIAEQYDFVYAIIGFHPENIYDINDKILYCTPRTINRYFQFILLAGLERQRDSIFTYLVCHRLPCGVLGQVYIYHQRAITGNIVLRRNIFIPRTAIPVHYGINETGMINLYLIYLIPNIIFLVKQVACATHPQKL